MSQADQAPSEARQMIAEIRHAPKCKFCRHPALAQINEVLARLTKRELSRVEVIEQIEALGLERPQAGDGWKHHWKKTGHYYIQTPGEARKAEEREGREHAVERELADEALRLIAHEMGGDDWRERNVTPTPEQILSIQRALYVHSLERRLEAGLPVDITHDHVQKAISETTKRRQSEAVAGLNAALAGAVGAITEKALGSDLPALPPADFVVVDAREVPDGE